MTLKTVNDSLCRNFPDFDTFILGCLIETKGMRQKIQATELITYSFVMCKVQSKWQCLTLLIIMIAFLWENAR